MLVSPCFALRPSNAIGQGHWGAVFLASGRRASLKASACPLRCDGRTEKLCDTPSRFKHVEASTTPAVQPISRRLAAVTAASIAMGLPLGWTALAESGPLPATCGSSEYDAAVVPPGVVPYMDPAGRFRLVRPCGWTQVTSLPPESSVLASFYNPEEPGAETLAVYRAAAPTGVQQTAQLGTAQDVARSLAGIAPNGLVIGARSVRHGDRDYRLAHVQFGGNTAGRFGAAREFRATTLAQGVQYTLRLTTTRYRYLAYSQTQQLMEAISDSFEVLV